MKLFLPDYVLSGIYDFLGPVWFIAAIGVLAYVIFADLLHAFGLTIVMLLCSQVWNREPLRDLGIFAGTLRWLLFLILFLRGVVYLVRTKAPLDEPLWARRIMIALSGLTLASAAWSDSGAGEYTLSLAVSFCLGIVVTFGLVWRLSDDPEFLPRIARSVVVLAIPLFGSGFLLGGLGYALKRWDLVENTKLVWEPGQRYQGILYNPNAIGLVGAVLLPVLVAAPREHLRGFTFLRLPAIVLTVASIFLSGSRSALIGSALAILILVTYRYRAGALAMVAVAGLATWGFIAFGRFDGNWDVDSSSVGHIVRTKHLSTLSGRTELWETGWEAAQGHLLLGQGWGSNRNVEGGVDLERSTEYGHVTGATNLHNAHLQMLLDLGFVGIALFWAFCGAVIAAGWAILRAPRSRENELGVVIFTSALALIADTWVHGGIWSIGNPTTLAFWSLCVITLKQGHAARKQSRLAEFDEILPAQATLSMPA